jgi:YfiR/HmsC-like
MGLLSESTSGPQAADSRRPSARLAPIALWCATVALMLLVSTSPSRAEVLAGNQVEAVFLFNFSHFVEWPSPQNAEPGAPYVIGILGDDEFGTRLDETVRGEVIDNHPLIVRRFHHIEEVTDCRILFIDHSENDQLSRILSALNHRSTLTVSDIPGAAEHGVMIQFVIENNRVRLRINQSAARAANLTLSSNLLRVAELVSTSTGE